MKRSRAAGPVERTREPILVVNLLRQSEEYYEFRQPLAGGGVAGNGLLQKPPQDRGRLVAHGPRSLRCGRRVLRFTFFKSGAVIRKKIRFGDIPRGGCRRGKG